MKARFLLLLLVLTTLVYQDIFAQSFAEFERRFVNAKQHFDNKNYVSAVEGFKTVMQNHTNNTYVIYAHFFCALSHFELKQFADSKVILAKVLETYPKWTQIEDVQYWYALCQFELGMTADAMKILSNVEKNYGLSNVSQLAKKRYLPLQSYEQLRFLYITYPNDRALAESLADKVAAMPEASRDKNLLLEIKTKFGYSPAEPQKNTQTSTSTGTVSNTGAVSTDGKNFTSDMKPAYNVALLLPLNLSDFDPNTVNRRNQYIMDLYSGIKIAADEINADGKKINLFFFDTERDAAKVSSILTPNEIAKTDLVIGPVTAAGFQNAQKILATNKPELTIFHPFAAYGELTAGKENAFLFESSYQAQARISSKVMVDSLKRKKAYIIYGETRSDSVLAFQYKAEIERRGGKVMLFAHYASLSGAFKKLKEQLAPVASEPPRISEKDRKEMKPEELVEKTKSKEDPEAHIAVFTTQQALAINVMSIVRISGIDIPMVVNKEWLNFEQVGFDTFNDKNIFILYPSYTDANSENMQSFIKTYIAETNMYPSDYAVMGYELMYVLGKQLIENGTGFRKVLLSKKHTQGKLMYKHNFFGTQYNGAVTLLQFKSGLALVLTY